MALIEATEIEFCHECGQRMEITTWPSRYTEGVMFRKAECKTHGRKFSRIQEATEVTQYLEAKEMPSVHTQYCANCRLPFNLTPDLNNPLDELCAACRKKATSIDLDTGKPFESKCNRCEKRKTGRVYANNEYGLICEECHWALDDQGMSDAAIRSHMQDILSGD